MRRIASRIYWEEQKGKDVTQLLREQWKIFNWLYPNWRDTYADASTLQTLHWFGMSVASIERCRVEKGARGRPVTARGIAVKAFREKFRNPDRLYIDILQDSCPCGQNDHAKCVRALLRQIRLVKVFLRKWGYEFDISPSKSRSNLTRKN
jgi:hypothetical protein